MRAMANKSAEPDLPVLRPASILRDERGVAIVEFALVVPVLLLLVIGIIQFGAAFFLQNEMLNVAREASRRLATGGMTSAQASAWVAGQMPGQAPTVVVTPPAGSNDRYTITVSLPMKAAVGIDPFGLFAERTLTATVSMRSELAPTT